MALPSSTLRAYGLHEHPFTPDPDPRYTYLTASFRNILSKAEFAVEHCLGPVVTYGEEGTGKTILARILWQRFADRPITSCVLMDAQEFTSANRFLRTLLLEFRVGKTAKAMEDSYALFLDHLRKLRGEGKTAVLLLDKGELLSAEDFGLLARLDAETHKGQKLFQIVVFGNFPMYGVVPFAPVFASRISLMSYQESLAFEEMEELLRFEWLLAGGGQDLPFSHQALEAIYKLGLGNARKINDLAARALERAKGKDVEIDHVR